MELPIEVWRLIWQWTSDECVDVVTSARMANVCSTLRRAIDVHLVIARHWHDVERLVGDALDACDAAVAKRQPLEVACGGASGMTTLSIMPPLGALSSNYACFEPHMRTIVECRGDEQMRLFMSALCGGLSEPLSCGVASLPVITWGAPVGCQRYLGGGGEDDDDDYEVTHRSFPTGVPATRSVAVVVHVIHRRRRAQHAITVNARALAWSRPPSSRRRRLGVVGATFVHRIVCNAAVKTNVYATPPRRRIAYLKEIVARRTTTTRQ